MDDPWDVKSVQKSGQYTSCMKINGVPLLPPVLSRECRSEMQYYKLLAKEVEKRISILQPYIEDTDSSDDKTDILEITDCEEEDSQNMSPSKITDVDVYDESDRNLSLHTKMYNFTSRNVADITNTSHMTSETHRNEDPPLPEVIDIPERDCNCVKPSELKTDVELKNFKCQKQQDAIIEEIVNFSLSITRDKSTESYLKESLSQEEPPSISTKSFTGSLNNLHMLSESVDNIRPLVRQHSYTILNPSPQLLAHLEVQSLNLGVDVSCISMSESLTNLRSPGKKRRNWDLESAKVKWSTMAMELKQKNLSKPSPKKVSSKGMQRTISPSRAKCVAAARTKYSTLTLKQTTKSVPGSKNSSYSPPRTRTSSPGRFRASSPVREATSSETVTLEPPSTDSKYNIFMREPTSPKTLNISKEQELSKTPKEFSQAMQKNQPKKTVTPHAQKQISEPITNSLKTNGVSKENIPKHLSISECEDPAAKVRELYEKIQQQQKAQMAGLMEKQKREQILLQQAFEEQNNLLFKQLKTICPKSPEKITEAWGDKTDETTRGPVSLSQLISLKLPDHTVSVSSTLTDSNNCINNCNTILRQSKDVTASIKSVGKSVSQNPKLSANINLEGSRTRTNSPTSSTRKSTSTTSRRLNYETNSEQEYDVILTDRTNDTLADLNVTFPTDSEDTRPSSNQGPDVTVIHKNTPTTPPIRSTDSAIKCMEQTIQRSINSCNTRNRNQVNFQPTARQQAAATTIVAHVRGYLVRRLMRTARVQATVQTIKDALLCALELHQDREGIRGADVDLHRRLIQQITAACYALHDTFVASSPAERCAMIAADRSRRASHAKPLPKYRHSDVMSQSHSGVLLPRLKRFSAPPATLMTQSNHETYSNEAVARYMPSPRRRPWR